MLGRLAATAALCAGGQTGRPDGRAPRPRQAVQAPQPRAQVPAHPLGRLIRDICWKTVPDAALTEIFAISLSRADQVRRRRQRQRGWKLCSLHAPEVECIGKGKARGPFEFGCKVFVATPVTQPKGGQFVLHAKALHGDPYDGHTLGPILAEMAKLTGVAARRAHVDKGYRGHSHPHKFRVWISGQVRRVTRPTRHEMKCRTAIEPMIGHVKEVHHMERSHLKGRDGDRIDAIMDAADRSFSFLLRSFEATWRPLITARLRAPPNLLPT